MAGVQQVKEVPVSKTETAMRDVIRSQSRQKEKRDTASRELLRTWFWVTVMQHTIRYGLGDGDSRGDRLSFTVAERQ